MNLVRAELHRLLARRFTRVLLILMAAAFILTLLTTAATSHRPTQDELISAEQEANSRRVTAALYYRNCLQERTAQGLAGDGFCTSPSDIRTEDYLADVFVFEQDMPDLLYFLAAFVALFGFLIGASYVGAELTSGGMTNLLLWRPQRDVVLATKLGVLLGTVAVLSLAASAVYVGAFWGLASAIGFPGSLGAPFWTDLLLFIARGALLGLVCAAIGFGFATLGRHTSTALGVVAGYLVVWEFGARIMLLILGSNEIDRWVFSTYIGAWLGNGSTISDYDCSDPASACLHVITVWQAGGVLALLAAAVAGSAFLVFRTRDVA